MVSRTLTRGLSGALASSLTGIVSASASPPPPPPPQTAQTADFGALTLASAGGFKPLDSNDAEVNLTAITDAGTGTRTWSISSGALIANGTPGVDDGRILVCTGSDANTYTITINSQADTYSARTVAEMEAVNALGTSTLDNKTLRLRPGLYEVWNSSSWLTNRAFTTLFTIASHDVDAFTGIGEGVSDTVSSTSHERVKLLTKKGTNNTNIANAENLTFDGLCIEGGYDRRLDTTTAYALRSDGGMDYVTWRNCYLKGDADQLGPGPNFRGLIGGDGNYRPRNCSWIDCRFAFTGRGLNGPGSDSTVLRCQFDQYQADAIIISSATTVQDCLFFATGGDQTDPNGDLTRLAYESPVTGLSNSQMGSIAFRFRPLSVPASVQTLLAGMHANSNARVSLEITASGKLRFFAKDTSGNTVVDMTSTLDVENNCQHNVLISVDTTGTSRMYLWIEGGAAGRSADEETITDTSSSETINWATAQGWSLWARDDGTNAGDQNYDGAISHCRINSGETLDVTSEAVRDLFFDDTEPYGPYKTDYVSTYGTGPVDLRGDVRVWRSGINEGTGEDFTIQTSGSIELDVYHIDVLQAIRNTGSNRVLDTSKDADNITIRGNIFVAVKPDGTPDSAGGSQGIFMEDIQASYNYKNTIIEGNLFIGAASHGITIYNTAGGRIIHNTAVSPTAFGSEIAGNFGVRTLFHTAYSNGWTIDVDGKTGTILAGDYIVDPQGKPAVVHNVEAQDATTATLRLQGVSSVGGGANNTNDFDFDDNDALTFTGSGATASVDGDMYWQLPRGLANASTVLDGNTGGFNTTGEVDSNGTTAVFDNAFVSGLPATFRDNYTHGSDVDAELSTMFAGYSGSFTGLTNKAALVAMFSTNSSLRTGREIKFGWDAYTYGQSPLIGTCTSFSMTDATNQTISTVVESAAVTPSGISQYGCALRAWAAGDTDDRQEVQILQSDETTVVHDWSEEALEIRAGETFKVRTTSSGVNSTGVDVEVLCGDQTDTWTVTTRAATNYILDEFTTDTTSAWSVEAGTFAYDAVNDGITLQDTADWSIIRRVYKNADAEVVQNITTGSPLNLRIEFTWAQGEKSTAWDIGTETNDLYVDDERTSVAPFTATITPTTAGELSVRIILRGTGTSSHTIRIDKIQLFAP